MFLQFISSADRSWFQVFTCSVPDNTQLQVYYSQISVLTHKCEVCASRWCHIFSDQDDQQCVRKQCEIEKEKSPLPNQIPIGSGDWFKSLPEVLFQCWLVENSLPFPAIFTGLLSLLILLKGVNMCSAKKSLLKISSKPTMNKLFHRRNFGSPAECTSLPNSAQLKPDL